MYFKNRFPIIAYVEANTTPAREELLELCRRDPEEVVKLIELLIGTITGLKERVTQFEQQLNQDSHKSNKPPSSDGLRRAIKTTRMKSHRSSGGQKGHKGSTLAMTDKPDKVVEHSVDRCSCGYSLKRIPAQNRLRRQVIDIPALKIETIEHQSEVKQ